jgi:outer membrane immunogenic protein
MKFLLSNTAAAALIGGSALAADLPARAPAPASYDWTGVYFGGHLGGAWQSASFQDPSATQNITLCCDLIGSLAPGAATSNATGSGFLGGGQFGFNYQIGRLVVGSDFDFSGTSLTGNSVGVIPGATSSVANVTETFGIHTDWTATATSTIGIAKDRWMWYNKAGAAWAHDSYSLGLTGVNQGFGPAGSFGFQSTASGTRVGWTVGTGIQWAFADNWSAKIEYDYLDFGSKGVNFSGIIQNPGGGAPITNASTFNTNNSQYISEVKFGVNYKLSPGFLFW